MNFDEYQRLAYEYAVYPKDSLYPILAMGEEVGEFQGKIAKLIRAGCKVMDLDNTIFREGIKKELGDILWNLSACAADFEISLDDVAKANLDKLLSRRKRDLIQGEGDDR